MFEGKDLTNEIYLEDEGSKMTAVLITRRLMLILFGAPRVFISTQKFPNTTVLLINK